MSDEQAKRLAETLGFTFYIDQYGYLTTFGGYKSECRKATDEELQMWRALGGVV